MNRTEALSTLRLDATADGALVESAYWHLVQEAQGGGDTIETFEEIERLNQARDTLAPNGRRGAPMQTAGGGAAVMVQRDGMTGIGPIDWFVDWVSAEALRVRLRWPGRNLEIALIGGAAIVLWVLAIGAGASVMATFIAAGLIFAAIWAPWRRA